MGEEYKGREDLTSKSYLPQAPPPPPTILYLALSLESLGHNWFLNQFVEIPQRSIKKPI
jgi:hypothetical protein